MVVNHVKTSDIHSPTDLTSGSCATCELESCFRAQDQEVECDFLDGGIFYSCRSSHLEMTSLIVIDPLSPGEPGGTPVNTGSMSWKDSQPVLFRPEVSSAPDCFITGGFQKRPKVASWPLGRP